MAIARGFLGECKGTGSSVAPIVETYPDIYRPPRDNPELDKGIPDSTRDDGASWTALRIGELGVQASVTDADKISLGIGPVDGGVVEWLNPDVMYGISPSEVGDCHPYDWRVDSPPSSSSLFIVMLGGAAFYAHAGPNAYGDVEIGATRVERATPAMALEPFQVSVIDRYINNKPSQAYFTDPRSGLFVACSEVEMIGEESDSTNAVERSGHLVNLFKTDSALVQPDLFRRQSPEDAEQWLLGLFNKADRYIGDDVRYRSLLPRGTLFGIQPPIPMVAARIVESKDGSSLVWAVSGDRQLGVFNANGIMEWSTVANRGFTVLNSSLRTGVYRLGKDDTIVLSGKLTGAMVANYGQVTGIDSFATRIADSTGVSNVIAIGVPACELSEPLVESTGETINNGKMAIQQLYEGGIIIPVKASESHRR